VALLKVNEKVFGQRMTSKTCCLRAPEIFTISTNPHSGAHSLCLVSGWFFGLGMVFVDTELNLEGFGYIAATNAKELPRGDDHPHCLLHILSLERGFSQYRNAGCGRVMRC
jgi:hypothetical protein